MTGLWAIAGISAWMVIGAVIVGVSDAFSNPEKRSLVYKSVDQLFILFCIIVAWPLLLILIVARLAFMLTVVLRAYARDRINERKSLVNQDWE